jgi:hypothetical protein
MAAETADRRRAAARTRGKAGKPVLIIENGGVVTDAVTD